MPQNEPLRGGSVHTLWEVCNISETDRRLFAAAVGTSFVPDIPHHAMILHGEPGTGKSTITRCVKQLVDPSAIGTLALPARPQELHQVLDHHYVAPFDNVSSVTDETSDALCRAITGEGTSVRMLYTDDEDQIRTYRRVILLNGIGSTVERADLLDQSLVIETRSIDTRHDEQHLNALWEYERPRVLGALLDALSHALKRRGTVRLEKPPRMADAACYYIALGPDLGYTRETILADLAMSSERRGQDLVDESPLGCAVRRLLGRSHGEWSGTASDLLAALREAVDTHDVEDLPRTPAALSRELNLLRAPLAQVGVFVERKRLGEAGQKVIVLTTRRQIEML
jgi:energy-coupling factor transporter ATP-binding protein EcfA2